MSRPNHPEAVVKCGCGKVFRLKNWSSHKAHCTCSQASLSAKDIDVLLAEEAQKKENIK